MIEINLIPKNLRKKKKKGLFGKGLNVPIEIIIGVGGGIVMLFILIHVGLFGLNMIRLAQLKSLESQWAALQPQKEEIDSVMNEMRTMQSRQKSLSGILNNQDLVWSRKLNILSDVLPRGVWLYYISFSNNKFYVEGSAIARQNNEMINVHTLTSNLKGDKGFMANFDDLELGSIQRRKIGKTEVADFVIIAQHRGQGKEEKAKK